MRIVLWETSKLKMEFDYCSSFLWLEKNEMVNTFNEQ